MKAVEQTPYEDSPISSSPHVGRDVEKRSTPRSRWVLLTVGIVVLGIGLIVAGLSMADRNEASVVLIPVVVESTDAVGAATGRGSEAAPVILVPETIDLPSGDVILSDASIIGDAVVPSIVTVQVYAQVSGAGNALLGSGSGVIYDAEGRIVTNAHVVDSGAGFEVVLADGRIYEATVVGVDTATDLAVLDIAADSVVPINLGSTDELSVGEPAVAVGSPLGLEGGPSLTSGVLSAFDREVQTDSTTTLFGMLQTDAPITEGSSGGALVDGQGRLIGITTAVGVSSVGVEGIGFATRVEIVSRVVDELIAEGVASEPYLGIVGATAFETLPDGGRAPIGVQIESVESGSAADQAGIRAGDTLTAISGVGLETMDELVAALRRYEAGATVELDLLRADAFETLAVVLGDR
jgi:S1-C subfamily serine protease